MPVPPPETGLMQRRLRTAEVHDWLFAAIIDGTLAPGERIRDSELETWFGVSRTPIRLAIHRLEDVGLVESRPNRYTRVAASSPALVPALLGVMCGFWSLAVRLTIARLTADDEERCCELLGRAVQACDDFAESDGSGAFAAVETLREALFFFSVESGNPLLRVLVVRCGSALRYQVRLQGKALDWLLFRAVFASLRQFVAERDADGAADAFRMLRAAHEVTV